MAGTFETVALHLGRLLQPLEDRLTPSEVRELFAELGMQFPPELEAQAGLLTALTTAASSAARLAELIPQLEADTGDGSLSVTVGAEVVEVAATLLDALATIATSLGGLGAALPGIDAGDLADFVEDLAVKLLDYLIVVYLESYYPVALQFAAFFGIVEIETVPGDAADPTKPSYKRRKLRLDRLGELFESPEDMLSSLYGWGDATFDGKLLLRRTHDVFAALAIPVEIDVDAVPPALRLKLLRISPRTDLNPRGLEAILEVSLPAELHWAMPLLQPHWALELEASGRLTASTGITIQPPADISLVPPSGTIEGETAVRLWRGPAAPETRLKLLDAFGIASVTAERIGVGVLASFRWASGAATADFGIEGRIDGGKLHVGMESADGFLAELLAGFALDADFDLGFGWTAGGGVFFTGSGALEVQLPLHIALGPVELTALTISIGMENTGFPIGVTADLKASLGPLKAVVEQIGVEADLVLTGDGSGNLGPVDLSFEFKPPKGVGLSLDVGVVSGGGYLFIDADRGEYAGILELTLGGVIGLTAIGLITTRMPDGSEGFSLLIIMTADFGTGIQLGYGFTLLAVGGLIGLNRTMNLEALMEGVRTGSIESMMFPQDVIANAPRIISDLRTIFPPEEGVFLIGPMLKLGWGTPTIISVSAGVIIEIPGNIAVVGILKLALPADEIALIVIQVNFAGAIEFDRKRGYFFAALFESRVLFIPIEGEMGLLISVGSDGTFVLSVGGFHPRFKPPPLPFPSPRRVSIVLVSSPVARVRVEGYFAVTSNTVQFGARAELFFGLDELNVQGHIAFDALFQLSPFYFVIELSASFSAKVFGIGLFSVRVQGALEGPTPWRARGEGTITLLFFDVSADFDVTWGESRNTTLPPIEVMPLMEAELAKDDCWVAALPAGSSLGVTLRPLDESEPDLVLHPVGTLKISQRRLPLELTLDKVGTQKPSDVNKFRLAATGGFEKRGDTTELFAPAQFREMADAERLSAAAFASEKAGLEVGASGRPAESHRMVKRVVRYEEIIIDTAFKRHVRRFAGFISTLFDFFLNGASVARCDVSQAKVKQLRPFDDVIEVAPETFTVTFQETNAAYGAEPLTFLSEASARDFLNAEIAANPVLGEELHVVPTFELVS